MKIAIDVRNIGRGRTGSEVVVTQLAKFLIAQNGQITHSDVGTVSARAQGEKDVYYLLTDTANEDVIAQIVGVLDLGDGVAVAKSDLSGGELSKIQFAQKNVELVSLCASNKFAWAAWVLPRWLRQVAPDVFHTEYILPFFVPRSIKMVTHIHDVSFVAMSQIIKWRDLVFLKLLIPYSLRRADAVIAISEFTRDEIVKYYADKVPQIAQKLHVVTNAVGAEFAQVATDAQIAQVAAKYKLPAKYIFSLGTMQPRKNIPFLVRAFAQFAQKVDDVDLVLSGQRAHNFDEAIDEIVAGYGEDIAQRIHFTGFVDASDLPAVFAGAQVFAFTSLYEGFGLPLLEAMSQNVPTVANDIPVFREVAGGDGALFAPASSGGDLAQFADNLYTGVMNDNVRKRLVARGTERVSAYSWERSAQEFHTILCKLV